MRSLDTDSGHRYSRPVVIASLGLIAVAAALVWAIVRPSEQAEPPPPPVTAAPTAPGPPTAETAETAVARVDVARISAEGNTVIAGRAAPGATVDIASNGRSIGSVTADGRGEWVFVPEAPLPPGAHRLTLSTRQSGDTKAVPGEGEVLIVVPSGGRDIAGRPAAQSRPLAILIPGGQAPDGLTQGEGEAVPRVLQKPGGGETAPGALAIDVVGYAEGRLTITGRASAGATVRLFLDGRPLGSAVAGADGRWSLTVRRPGLGGAHTLAAEATGSGARNGRFTGRLLLAPPTAATGDGRPDDELLIVEPGENLWRIARRTYGQGIAFTIIYDANRGRIGDPDLIYPGQALSLPARSSQGAAPRP